MNQDEVKLTLERAGDSFNWFYEARSGGAWWMYERRTSIDIESAKEAGEPSCRVRIAGFPYVIDFERMVQYREDIPARQRRIKRDTVATSVVKGVAGICLPVTDGEGEGGGGGGRQSREGRRSDRSAIEGGEEEEEEGVTAGEGGVRVGEEGGVRVGEEGVVRVGEGGVREEEEGSVRVGEEGGVTVGEEGSVTVGEEGGVRQWPRGSIAQEGTLVIGTRGLERGHLDRTDSDSTQMRMVTGLD